MTIKWSFVSSIVVGHKINTNTSFDKVGVNKHSHRTNKSQIKSPAGIDKDNELLPQGGITDSQMDLAKGPLVVPDDPAGIKTIHSIGNSEGCVVKNNKKRKKNKN